MKQQDLFTNNLIQLMRDVLAGPVLSRIQRARLDSRIRMQMQIPPVEPFSSLKGELRETPRSGEEAQRYLWPLDAFIPELTEEPMEWEAFMRSEPEPQISLPKIPHETRMPEAQGWLFSIRDEPSADVSLPSLLSPAFQEGGFWAAGRGLELDRSEKRGFDTLRYSTQGDRNLDLPLFQVVSVQRVA